MEKWKKILTVNMELVKCLGVQPLLAQVVVVVATTSMYWIASMPLQKDYTSTGLGDPPCLLLSYVGTIQTIEPVTIEKRSRPKWVSKTNPEPTQGQSPTTLVRHTPLHSLLQHLIPQVVAPYILKGSNQFSHPSTHTLVLLLVLQPCKTPGN